jgi:hypothetical protein
MIHYAYLLLIYDSSITESPWIYNKPLMMTHSFIYASYPLLIDICTYPQHVTLSPLDSYHSIIPTLFHTFLLDDIPYLL